MQAGLEWLSASQHSLWWRSASDTGHCVCVHGCGHCVCTWVWSLCVQVGKPNIGENRPSRVRADVTINVKVKDPVRREWEGVSTLCTQLYT